MTIIDLGPILLGIGAILGPLGAIIVGLRNGRKTDVVHNLVNTQMDDFRAALRAEAEAHLAAAVARAVIEGLRDKSAALETQKRSIIAAEEARLDSNVRRETEASR